MCKSLQPLKYCCCSVRYFWAIPVWVCDSGRVRPGTWRSVHGYSWNNYHHFCIERKQLGICVLHHWQHTAGGVVDCLHSHDTHRVLQVLHSRKNNNTENFNVAFATPSHRRWAGIQGSAQQNVDVRIFRVAGKYLTQMIWARNRIYRSVYGFRWRRKNKNENWLKKSILGIRSDIVSVSICDGAGEFGAAW